MVGSSGPRWAMWRCACVLAVLCVALLRCSALKRAEMSAVPFVLSSRYGRSPPRMLLPRSDRSDLFFMGSRYGKRAAGGTCDCARPARRPPQGAVYRRSMGAPERVPDEA